MAAAWNDGTVRYGSRVLTITDTVGNTYGSYVCDSISMNRPATVIERTDQLGEPSGSVGVNKFVNGSVSGAQFASGTAKQPLNGYTCTFTADPAPGTAVPAPETFFIRDVSVSENKDSETKFNFNLTKKYN